MSAIRPEQIKQEGVFIPAIDPETNAPVSPVYLLTKLGELGYRGAVVDISEKVPEEILPHDPEADGLLGYTDYEELATFVASHGSKVSLATQIWNRFTAVSVQRAVNNRFWHETVDLREKRARMLKSEDEVIDDLSARAYVYSEGRLKTNDNVRAELDAAREAYAEQRTEFERELITAHDSITGQETPESYADQKLRQILYDLKDPTEVGEPFVFVRNEVGDIEPIVNSSSERKKKSNAGMVMDLTEAYKAFVSKDVFRYNQHSQKLPQLTIKFFNKKIQAHQDNQ